MIWSVAARVRIRRARRQHWDRDIIRGLGLTVPKSAQDRARELLRQRKFEEAIVEIRKATGYDRADARCVAHALMYRWKLPTPVRRRSRRTRA
ncbi:hypothetical protein [Actinacidiphila guanduensis]|uniref:Uncharacterized protein n=1 Tax=Actinacidiphila guanduensis TaxID=310781 RepID=A0A1G9Y6S6_9ACTN|nr:hypothetical protein [Actinacidiphila guanduensis]SDN04767.1 hypothetical protein SAMN05216259_102435 [Actinacidiphila guanduensis]